MCKCVAGGETSAQQVVELNPDKPAQVVHVQTGGVWENQQAVGRERGSAAGKRTVQAGNRAGVVQRS